MPLSDRIPPLRRSQAALFLTTIVALACSPTASPRPTLPAAPSQPLQRPFFWQVTGPDATDNAPSYLFGTRHIGIDPYQVLPLRIWRALDDARALVMEADLTGPDALGLGMLPEGTTLDQLMKPEDWATVVQSLSLDEHEADAIKTLQPWMLVVQLTQTLVPDVASIEGELQKRATEQRKERAFLDTISTQAKLLERFMDIEYLLYFVTDLERQKKSLARGAEIYLSGDAEALYQSAIVGMQKHIGADGMEALMFARNRSWMAPIEQQLTRGNAFIMVGVAHLVGEHSVVDLLRKRGYTVTRLSE